MITVEEAQARILSRLSPVSTEIAGLDNAWGRVLAADLVARRTQPPFPASAMDGYAVRGADVAEIPARLTVIGESRAGAGFSGTIGPNQSVRIFTGAPVPEGADRVVIQENTSRDGNIVTVREAGDQASHIRAAGVDFTAGSLGLTSGKRLSARDIGLAAAMNHPWIEVYRQPRIAILATGDEIVLPGEALGPDQIIGSNGPAIAALVRAAGGIPTLLPIVPDDPAALAAGIKAAIGVCDLLVTIGGASVGDHDLVAQSLGLAGMTLEFWRIAMRPGKPLLFGTIGALPVLGLPGNPVSALLTGLIFLRPAIDALQGLPPQEHWEQAATTAPLPVNGIRQDYVRATLTRSEQGDLLTAPLKFQDSSLTSVLATADCLIRRPPHAGAVPAGGMVSVMRLGMY